MGEPGRRVLGKILPGLKDELAIDFVIVQSENSADDGKSPTPGNLSQMQTAGADFFTGGNHSFAKNDEVYSSDLPIVRPCNVLGNVERGYKIIEFNDKRILIASFLGQIVGSQKLVATNPLQKIDEILEKEAGNFDISIINFHGDYSSEKIVFGYHVDGRVNAVIGDHWHVPTADAMIFPQGTAHITDVGMTGCLHSSLGVKTDVIINRWLNGVSNKNELETEPPFQFNAVLFEIDETTNKTKNITQVQRILEV
jgi:metallophosphoesterase (TIGR00282 family)